MTEQESWRVVSYDGRKTFFEGTEEDARAYVENNFPRVHIEPGVNYGDEGPLPDVKLTGPGNVEATFKGKNWSDTEPTPAPESEQNTSLEV